MEFHLISLCWNFVEKYSFCRALGKLPKNTAETVRFDKVSTPEICVNLQYFIYCNILYSR